MNVEGFQAALAQAATALRQAAQRGMEAGAQQVLAEAQALVPVDTGDLRDSGHVRMEGNTAVVVFDSDHAAVIHERTDLAHHHGQAHFLSDPLIHDRERTGAKIAETMRGAT